MSGREVGAWVGDREAGMWVVIEISLMESENEETIFRISKMLTSSIVLEIL